MYKIIKKQALNPTVTLMEIHAPIVSAKAQAGQFIILRSHDDSERIPLTVADYDRKSETITIIFQLVGKATM
ncbi:MAG: sulfide/dihydroorotate dehydrogenase-like FAD/NAD-binding protein, partial [Clostridia bacterium]